MFENPRGHTPPGADAHVHPTFKKLICHQPILYTDYKYCNEIPVSIRAFQNITCFANIVSQCLLFDYEKECWITILYTSVAITTLILLNYYGCYLLVFYAESLYLIIYF